MKILSRLDEYLINWMLKKEKRIICRMPIKDWHYVVEWKIFRLLKKYKCKK